MTVSMIILNCCCWYKYYSIELINWLINFAPLRSQSQSSTESLKRLCTVPSLLSCSLSKLSHTYLAPSASLHPIWIFEVHNYYNILISEEHTANPQKLHVGPWGENLDCVSITYRFLRMISLFGSSSFTPSSPSSHVSSDQSIRQSAMGERRYFHQALPS